MNRKNQLNLIPQKNMKSFKAWTHGGVSLKKRRKKERPLVPKQPTHVVFKSSKARGKLSFYHHKRLVNSLLKERANKFFVEILEFVNMGNHIHLKVKFNDKLRFKKFLISFPALLARKITGARKGKPFGQFWDGLVYTRVITSKLEEWGLKGYFEGNHRERELGYAERTHYLKQFNQYIYRLKSTRAGPRKPIDALH